MKAMILAAGLGTRLKPLTDRMPKALVPVAGEPMLKRVIEQLKEVGFTHIVINVHHLAEQITDYLKENNNFGIEIEISDEQAELLDTGGGLLHAYNLLSGDCFMTTKPYSNYSENEKQDLSCEVTDSGMIDNSFLVHNVDILSNCNLKKLCSAHKEVHPGANATMLVSDRNSSRKLLFDKCNRLCGWINKNSGETKPKSFVYNEGEYNEYAFSGIQVVNIKTLALMKKYGYSGKFSIIDFYMDMLDKGELEAYGFADPNLRLLDIGKPDTLIEAESFVKEIK